MRRPRNDNKKSWTEYINKSWVKPYPSGYSVLTSLVLGLEAICTIAAEILEQKAPCQQDPDEEEEEAPKDDQAECDSILISSAGSIVASLASVMGPDFSEIFNTFFPLVSKYYVSVFDTVGMNYMNLTHFKKQKKNRSETDRQASINCVTEIIEGMKGSISSHTEPILVLLHSALSDSEFSVLNDAAYGLGLLVENSQADLSQRYLQLLSALHPLFAVTPDAPALKLSAKDNATGAVARLIIRNTAAIPLDQVLPIFINALPLKNDYLENRPVFLALFHLFRTNGAALYPFMDRLLLVFTHVLDSSGEEQITEDIRTELIHLIALINQEVPEKVQAAGLGRYILPGA